MYKYIKYICLLLMCTLTISGCNYNKKQSSSMKNIQNEKSQIERDMEFLTSDECDGRRPGTSGNEKAGMFIADRFKDIGLEPFDEDYLIPYTKKTETLDEKTIKLELYDEDKLLETFEYGRDFIEIFIDNIDLSLPLVTSVGEVDCAVLIEDPKEVVELSKNPHVKLILMKREENNRVGAFYKKGYIPELGISQVKYDKLKGEVGKTIRFTADVTMKDMLQNNIVGMIKGSNSENALIISAHFDHVGSIDDMVWRGALDNASGVCTLLGTAQTLSDYYQQSKPTFDIIFCAFNSEETISAGKGESGSSYFRSFIQEKYQSIFDINIDCLGNKDKGELLLFLNDTTTAKEIGENILENFKQADIDTVMKVSEITSDHKNFNDALLLTTIEDIQASKIHTLQDIPDNIDMKYLSDIGKILGDYVYNELNLNQILKENSTTEKQQVTQTSGEISYGITVSEFEELYHCKLDFADESLTKVFPSASNRADLKEPLTHSKKDNETKAKDMTLWDLRSFSFLINDTDTISFSTYDKSNSFEVMAYESDAEMNGYTKENLSYLTTIEDSKYYFIKENENCDQLYVVLENENYFIRVLIILTQKIDASPEECLEYFQKNIPIQYITEMVEMLFEAKEK